MYVWILLYVCILRTHLLSRVRGHTTTVTLVQWLLDGNCDKFSVLSIHDMMIGTYVAGDEKTSKAVLCVLTKRIWYGFNEKIVHAR